jgi:hypothetical protein
MGQQEPSHVADMNPRWYPAFPPLWEIAAVYVMLKIHLLLKQKSQTRYLLR